MRVISGTARGLKLISPEGNSTRPTLDRIKESLFNMIAPDIYDSCFLDLFSGSGSIGIEALSRGAKKAIFVDIDKKSIDIINKNIEISKFKEKSKIYNFDAINALEILHREKQKFDIIFLDPPYDKGLLEPVLKKIEDNNLLNEDGFIICEQHINESEFELEKLYIYKTKKYKITKMVFLKFK